MSKLNTAVDPLQQPTRPQRVRADTAQADDTRHLDTDAARHLTAIRIRGQLADGDGDGAPV